jgi:hypothetical protein
MWSSEEIAERERRARAYIESRRPGYLRGLVMMLREIARILRGSP